MITILLGSVGAFSAGFLMLNFLAVWQKENIDKPTNLLNALIAELKIIYSWAQPYDISIDIGDAKKMKKYIEFWNPSRVIFKFEYQTIQNILQTLLLFKLNPNLIDTCLKLRQSVDNFYQYYEEYRKFALSDHQLYMKMIHEISRDDNIFSNYKEGSNELNYLTQIFHYNYHLHFGLIANHEKDGLNKSFLDLSEQIGNYSISKPKWIKPVNIMSYLFMLSGGFMFVWFLVAVVIQLIKFI